MGRRDVAAGGQALELTFTEFQLLTVLARRPGWVFTRSQIVDAVRGSDYPVTDRSVDVQVVGLRKKLGRARRVHRDGARRGLPLQGDPMRRRARLVWRLFGSFTSSCAGRSSRPAGTSARRSTPSSKTRWRSSSPRATRLMQRLVAPHLHPLDAAAVDALCKRRGADSNTRYTVILPSGVVVGDTWETPANMDNHAARPEVAGALARGTESSRRFSTTLQRNVIYVATSVHENGRPVAVVRAAIPLSRMEEELDRLRSRFVGIGALIAGLALAVTLALSQRYGRKVRELQEGAARLAEGDLSQRLPAPDSEELAGLAESFNRMAAQIESRMQEVVRQRNQLEVVLSSMQEGVIAVDREERVISLNPAAARWFDLPLDRARGRSLQEVIRNLAIQKFVARSLQSRTPAEEDMAVFQNGERILNVRSTPLQGAGSETFGTLIVFNDVTQLRRLEDMRRDFVANVVARAQDPAHGDQGLRRDARIRGRRTPRRPGASWGSSPSTSTG